MVANKPGAPGRARSSRKVHRAGNAGWSAAPVVPAACILCCRRAMG